jgi:formate dehydrogenase major subunit
LRGKGGIFLSLSRRDFLKVSGLTLASTLLTQIGISPTLAKEVVPLRIRKAKITFTICPFCAVGCGLLVHSEDNKVLYSEGNPDHPINEGSACAKGSALFAIPNVDRRVTYVLYRAPNSEQWEVKSWDWALPEIAKRIKETRDKHFITKENGVTVNRCESIACLGGAAHGNEECYLLIKLMRALGLVYIEHQARI